MTPLAMCFLYSLVSMLRCTVAPLINCVSHKARLPSALRTPHDTRLYGTAVAVPPSAGLPSAACVISFQLAVPFMCMCLFSVFVFLPLVRKREEPLSFPFWREIFEPQSDPIMLPVSSLALWLERLLDC